MRIRVGREILALMVVAAPVTAAAQHIGQNASASQSVVPSISVSSQMVIEPVTVKDRNGKIVRGLTARDFVVTEEGVPQTVRFCRFQDLAKPQPAAATEPINITVYDQLALEQIAPEPPGSTRYKNKRLLAFYFDMTAMPPADQLRALAAAQQFIRTQMDPDDLIAIFRYAGSSVDVLQDFTNDRSRLLSILETLIVGEGQGFGESTDDAGASDTGAAFGQDNSEFNIFNTDRQLAGLETAAEMLGHLSEKKELIYFASGLRLNGLDNQAQLHATIDGAIRNGVSFWPIDARGLVAGAPLGNATQGSQGSKVMYSGAAAQALRSDFQQSQDTLYSLGEDTGGKALFDYNDLAKGIIRAAQAVSSYYILDYYTTNTAQDGKFRRIRISVKGDPSAVLDYRQGYYAGKTFRKFTDADRERQLEDALMLPDPITDLTIAMEIDYFQLNRAEYFVPIVAKIPGRELALAKHFGAEHTRIDFIGEIKDNYGTTVSNVRDKVDVKLSDATAAELAKRPVEYDTGFTLLPGKYTIKFLARDADTGRIGTYETSFNIPDLNRVTGRLAISSVILSSQDIDLKNALYNTVKKKALEESANPLVQDGHKLIPSVTRVFTRSEDMYVYLQAYEQKAQSMQPLVAFVALYHNQRRLFETKPEEVTAGRDDELRTVPLHFSIPLSQIPPEKYECQVTVLDPNANKVAFWRAPIMLLP
ncbi:MAG TPA: VWA domain-containing protein [Acidobacteriaceae bacterium]|nr:VWA domain-containing protein [Acidobacteriaceae bacterium]